MPNSLKINSTNYFLLVLLTVLITTYTYAQNIASTNKTSSKSIKINKKENYKILKYTDSITNQVIEERYFKSGQIKSRNSFLSSTIKKFHGKQTYWNKNGILHSEIYFKNGKKHGSFITYWENGQLKRQDFYTNGVFKEGFCWNRKGKNIKHSKFNIQPKFLGGSKGLIDYLSKNIQYPRNSRTASTRGKVMVSFNVEKDGEVSNVKIMKGVNLILNNEAKRVVQNMPKWNPALRDGNPIASEVTIPIVFLRH
ncbi:TonB family protein [Lutibacter sp.]